MALPVGRHAKRQSLIVIIIALIVVVIINRFV